MNTTERRLRLELDRYRKENAQLKEDLHREYFSVLKPIFRRFVRFIVSILLKLPRPLLHYLVRIKSIVFKKPILPDGQEESHRFLGQLSSEDSSVVQERLKALFSDVDERAEAIIIFAIIEWGFRKQRPQHFAEALARKGKRVVYISPSFKGAAEPGFALYSSPHDNIYLCQLFSPHYDFDLHAPRVSDTQQEFLKQSLSKMHAELQLNRSISIIQQPFWYHVAFVMPGSFFVYDCIDYHAGFENSHSRMVAAERQLILNADWITASSIYLQEHVQKNGRTSKLIRNAVSSRDFETLKPSTVKPKSSNFIIGYVGAISSWFDMDLMVRCAEALPHCMFEFVGKVEIKTPFKKYPENMIFHGEKNFSTVPYYINSFDICVIPFKLNSLTRCTNPVKVYEYLALGKNVVATRLPELNELSDFVELADNHDEFLSILRIMSSQPFDKKQIEIKRQWAKRQTWEVRTTAFLDSLPTPKLVSIIILSHNNFKFTSTCLESIISHTYYTNYEIIVVDNASNEETKEQLMEVCNAIPQCTLILNEVNRGFSAGNNIGLKQAKGEVLVLLNNDTFVTPGWLTRIVHHLSINDALTLVGPVTNNIGNHAKIHTDYTDFAECLEEAAAYTQKNINRLQKTDNVAFFCVAMRQNVLDNVGLLDENFGLGFFEDDDYCKRVLQLGGEIAIAHDVFVHHHLSASFDKVDSTERSKLFEKNRTYFESKWGPWVPHN